MIKAIVERHLLPGKEQEFVTLSAELWVMAMRMPGYITGETLQSIEEPGVWLTISSWSDNNTWRRWRDSKERHKIEKEIEPLLRAPMKESAFQQAFRE